MVRIVLFFSLFMLCSCTALHPVESGAPEGADTFDDRTEQPLGQLDLKKLAAKPLPPEKAAETMSELGKNWFYGHGFGETLVAAGLIAAFPPYAIYAVGNAALEYGGYKPLYVTNLLPAKERYAWRESYDTFVSGPGRLAASANGEQFRDRREVKVRTGRIVDEVRAEVDSR